MKTMKCLVAVFMMAMAFAVTGITAQAMEAAINPSTWTDLSKEPTVVNKTYSIPANSSIIIPINIPAKGGLAVGYAGDDATDTASTDLYANLYGTSACTSTVEYMGYVGTSGDSDVWSFDKAATYYIKVDNRSKTTVLRFQFLAYFINGADRTVKSGQTTAIFQNSYSQYVYTKFKATKTGYITVSAAEIDGSYVYVKLLNSSKKALSDEEMLQNESTYYGVQKGKTYYIATKTFGDAYNLKVKQTSVSEKSGSKKAKAVTMKKGKTYKGTQIANNKKTGTDWYKFKLTSSKALKITVNGRTTGYNGDLMIKISGGSGRWSTNTGRIPCAGKTTFTTSKLSPGTYYLQIYKSDKYSSGYYTISWK